MHNPFQPVEKIKAEVFMSMPAKFRKKSRTGWSDPNRQNAEVECFLEGPSFDREGNLWFVDIPFGRIFRISPKGEWELITQYDGWPNGLKFHKDGRAFICDYKCGLLELDTKTGKIQTVLGSMYSENFKGLNDLHFASNGDPHSGRIFEVDEPLTGYEDPGRPIPAFVTRLTGITDADVAGQRLDEVAIGALAESAGLVIAHNASFDRPFLEARMPAVFGAKPWACSCEEIPWDARGFPSRRLEYLLYQRHRLFFDAHSAEADCQALVHALAEPFEEGEYPLALLLESARRRTHRIWAIKAPFDLKDQLKARSYRFNGGTDGRPKAWYRDVPEGEEADAEMSWLRETVYGGTEGWQVEKFDARTRYGRRTGG